MQSQSFRIRVKGDRACFTRPEAKIERMSYEVMTPSAARGVLEAILWHKGITWVIEKIHVLKPIKFEQIRRNEVEGGCNVKGDYQNFNAEDQRTQRNTIYLTDVDYIIDAHFTLDTEKCNPSDNYIKFEQMMLRRIKKGQHYHQPYLGCREFPAYVEEAPEEWETPLEFTYRDFGCMFKDFDYSGETIKPMMFNAIIKNGCIEVPA